MLAPTLLLSTMLFLLGYYTGRRMGSAWIWIAAIIASLPAIAYAGYYSHVIDEPVPLYVLRAAPGSELLAAGLGFLVGFAAARARIHSPRYGMLVTLGIETAALAVLLVPYVKPVLMPAEWGSFRNQWDGPVAMQSTPYSCGPATAATILTSLGVRVTEQQLAREAFTSASGTENWYLARAIRNYGHSADFVFSNEILPSSIAGVRGAGWGHYVAIVSRNGDSYLVGDPLVGVRTYTEKQLRRRYNFTGFYLAVQ